MASPFAEAITQSMIAGLDPMNGVVKQFAEQQVAVSRETLNNSRLDTMLRLQSLITEAKDSGADGNIVAAYTRMLLSYSKVT